MLRSFSQNKKWLLFLPALFFLVSFYITYPGVTVLQDEATYIRQAIAFSEGNTTLEHINPLTGEKTEIRPSDYPPGTSLILALFVMIGGWSASFWMPALSLIIAFYFTVLLLRSVGYSEWFAILYFLFFPALIMGRVASSDVISGALIALRWWLFWQGDKKSGINNDRLAWWIGSGFVAGISILFRETNALLFFPLFLGTLIRLNKGWYWLLLGGLAGAALRPLLAYLLFGDPLFVKDPYYGFSLHSISANAPVYLIMLLVFVPGGLFFALIYRGNRAPEVVSTILLFVIFYLAYDGGGKQSGFAKSLVLGTRFFIPLLPVLYFAMAESVPRLLGPISLFDSKMVSRIKIAGISLITAGVILTNGIFYQWTSIQMDIQRVILQTVPSDAAIITNPLSTQKYISEVQGYNKRLDFRYMNAADLEGIDDLYIVFLQRSDSDFWREEAKRGSEFLSNFTTTPILEENFSGSYHLIIHRTIKNQFE